jgi:uncharacterized protein (UPF0262 family)
MRARCRSASTPNEPGKKQAAACEGRARRRIDRALKFRCRARARSRDLLEQNSFAPIDDDNGPYVLHLKVDGARLVFDIRRENGKPVVAHLLSLSPLRRIVKDYYTICDSYYQAIRTATPDKIEALDMGRRAIHNDGSRVLMERLKSKVALDHDTARRLFTLVCVLHWRG